MVNLSVLERSVVHPGYYGILNLILYHKSICLLDFNNIEFESIEIRKVEKADCHSSFNVSIQLFTVHRKHKLILLTNNDIQIQPMNNLLYFMMTMLLKYFG